MYLVDVFILVSLYFATTLIILSAIEQSYGFLSLIDFLMSIVGAILPVIFNLFI